jgi:F-type H+-transporting ATPase subunit epsilon
VAKLKLEIVTAERALYSAEVDAVTAPGADGELGILPMHAPLLAALKEGELRVLQDGNEQFIAVAGGFIEVLGDTVTILADAAERAEEIDLERAQTAMRRAQERLAQRGEQVDLERALASLHRAQIRVQVAQRRRRAGMGGGPPPETRP